nr:hypothetical protein [Candidatus Electrothrix aestuarii]
MIDLTITHVHQAWVGDITYITTETGFVYLALLTDVFLALLSASISRRRLRSKV